MQQPRMMPKHPFDRNELKQNPNSNLPLVISREVFETTFQVVPNNANGNCLFESLEFALPLVDDFPKPSCTAAKIRSRVARFYRHFDRQAEYDMHTIEYEIKLGLEFDNNDTSESGRQIRHDLAIAKNYVWASMTDALICGYIYNVDVYILEQYGFDAKGEWTHIEMRNMTCLVKPVGFVMLLYTDGNHFEAVLKLIRMNDIRTVNKYYRYPYRPGIVDKRRNAVVLSNAE